MTKQSYPCLFILTIRFIVCSFDCKPVSSEKLVQAISAIQGPFLKLFNKNEEDSFSANSFIEVHIVNMVKGSTFNWCSKS